MAVTVGKVTGLEMREVLVSSGDGDKDREPRGAGLRPNAVGAAVIRPKKNSCGIHLEACVLGLCGCAVLRNVVAAPFWRIFVNSIQLQLHCFLGPSSFLAISRQTLTAV